MLCRWKGEGDGRVVFVSAGSWRQRTRNRSYKFCFFTTTDTDLTHYGKERATTKALGHGHYGEPHDCINIRGWIRQFRGGGEFVRECGCVWDAPSSSLDPRVRHCANMTCSLHYFISSHLHLPRNPTHKTYTKPLSSFALNEVWRPTFSAYARFSSMNFLDNGAVLKEKTTRLLNGLSWLEVWYQRCKYLLWCWWWLEILFGVISLVLDGVLPRCTTSWRIIRRWLWLESFWSFPRTFNHLQILEVSYSRSVCKSVRPLVALHLN